MNFCLCLYVCGGVVARVSVDRRECGVAGKVEPSKVTEQQVITPLKAPPIMRFGEVGIGKVGFGEVGENHFGIVGWTATKSLNEPIRHYNRDSAKWDSAKWDSAKWDLAKWDSAKWEDTLIRCALMRNGLLRMHPNEKRTTEYRRSHAALLRYVVMAANQWAVSGCQWMHKKDQQQEQQPLKPHLLMFFSE